MQPWKHFLLLTSSVVPAATADYGKNVTSSTASFTVVPLTPHIEQPGISLQVPSSSSSYLVAPSPVTAIPQSSLDVPDIANNHDASSQVISIVISVPPKTRIPITAISQESLAVPTRKTASYHDEAMPASTESQNGSPLHRPATATPSPSYLVGSQTLTRGGPGIVYHGNTYSLPTSGTMIYVNGGIHPQSTTIVPSDGNLGQILESIIVDGGDSAVSSPTPTNHYADMSTASSGLSSAPTTTKGDTRGTTDAEGSGASRTSSQASAQQTDSSANGLSLSRPAIVTVALLFFTAMR